MATLSEYLQSKSISQSDFAETIGVDKSIVSRLAAGKMTPSLTLAARIEATTAGKVRAVEWVSGQEKPGASLVHRVQPSVPPSSPGQGRGAKSEGAV